MAYDAPTADDFIERFPEFEETDDEVVEAALTEAGRQVDDTWAEEDYATAIMYFAAHLLQLSGGAYDTGGLKSFSLGAISVTYADYAKQGIGTLETTSYGQHYRRLLRQNRGGPRVI